MVREPNLETVNRALSHTVRELMKQLNNADAEIRRLREELAAANRAADVNLGRS